MRNVAALSSFRPCSGKEREDRDVRKQNGPLARAILIPPMSHRRFHGRRWRLLDRRLVRWKAGWRRFAGRGFPVGIQADIAHLGLHEFLVTPH
jgi:hypothetical protein